MKISEITATDVTNYLRLESGEYDPKEITAIMTAAKKYISGYTGIPETSAIGGETLDDHEDFYIAFMVLCEDMKENKSLYVEKGNTNRVVECILGMHSRNLL